MTDNEKKCTANYKNINETKQEILNKSKEINLLSNSLLNEINNLTLIEDIEPDAVLSSDNSIQSIEEALITAEIEADSHLKNSPKVNNKFTKYANFYKENPYSKLKDNKCSKNINPTPFNMGANSVSPKKKYSQPNFPNDNINKPIFSINPKPSNLRPRIINSSSGLNSANSPLIFQNQNLGNIYYGYPNMQMNDYMSMYGNSPYSNYGMNIPLYNNNMNNNYFQFNNNYNNNKISNFNVNNNNPNINLISMNDNFNTFQNNYNNFIFQ